MPIEVSATLREKEGVKTRSLLLRYLGYCLGVNSSWRLRSKSLHLSSITNKIYPSTQHIDLMMLLGKSEDVGGQAGPPHFGHLFLLILHAIAQCLDFGEQHHH